MAAKDIDHVHMHMHPYQDASRDRVKRIFFEGCRVQQELLVLVLRQQAHKGS